MTRWVCWMVAAFLLGGPAWAMAPEEAPAVKEEAPAAKEEAPAPKEEAPAAKEEAPAAKKEAPAAKEEAPAAKEEAPAAKEEAPAAKEEAPAAKEEAPAAKEEAPAAKEEAPAAKEEVPAAKEEAPTAKEAPAAPVTLEGKINAVSTLEDAEALLGEVSKARGKDRKLVRSLLPGLLENGTSGQRYLALRYASKHRMKPPIVSVVPCFEGPEPELIELAVKVAFARDKGAALDALLPAMSKPKRAAIIKVADAAVARQLADRLKRAEGIRRFVIVDLLKQMPKMDDRSLRILVGLTDDESLGVSMIELLLGRGGRATRLLNDHARSLRRAKKQGPARRFVENLARVGDFAEAMVRPFLGAREPAVQLAALDAMASMIPEGTPLGFSHKLLSSKDPAVQERAVFLTVRGGDKEAIKTLHKVLESKSVAARTMAAWALGKFKDPSSEVPLITAFRREMQAPDEANLGARIALLKAMGALGQKNVVPVLINAMARRDQRDVAVDSAVRYGKDAASFLTFILQSLDTEREAAVAEALIRIGKDASVDVSKLLRHPNKRVQEIGISLLTIVGDAETAPVVREFLKEGTGVSTKDLLQSLRLYYFNTRELFLDALLTGKREARVVALKTILNMKDVEVLASVERLLDKEKDSEIRHLGLKLLWYLGAPGIEARLTELIQYEDEVLKLEGLRAIRAMELAEALPAVAGLLKGESKAVESDAARTIQRVAGVHGITSVGQARDWLDDLQDVRRKLRKMPDPRVAGSMKLADGAKLRYEIYGEKKGRSLVVIPGGPDVGMAYMRRWVVPLSKDRQILLYDPRGRGASATSDKPEKVSLQRDVDDLIALLDHLEFVEVDVLADGFGNMVLLQLLRSKPDRVERAILSCPPVPLGDDIVASLSNISALLTGVWKADYDFIWMHGSKLTPERFHRFLDRALLQAYFRDPRWLARLPDFHGNPILRGHLVRAVRGVDLRPVLEETKRSVLVILSKGDIFPAETMEWYVRLASKNKQVHMTTFGASGHFPFIEESERFIDTVKDFLD